jgi:hypothetical protein
VATSPVYASSGDSDRVILNNASGTSLSSAVTTGNTAGKRIKRIVVNSGPTTAPGTPVLFIVVDDGTNQVTREVLAITNTANIKQGEFTYDSFILKGSGKSIKFQMSSAITSGGTLHITIEWEDLT